MADFSDYYFTSYDNLASDVFGPEKDGELSYGYYLLIFGSVIIILTMMTFVIYNVVMKSEYHRANRVEFWKYFQKKKTTLLLISIKIQVYDLIEA